MPPVAYPPTFPPVLLVDPDPAHQHDLQAGLRARRVANPLVALDGLGQLVRHQAAHARLAPAAVLCALRLPDGTAWDALTLLRAQSATSRTPVLFLAEAEDADAADLAVEAGAAACLTWPVAGLAAVDALSRELSWLLVPTLAEATA